MNELFYFRRLKELESTLNINEKFIKVMND